MEKENPGRFRSWKTAEDMFEWWIGDKKVHSQAVWKWDEVDEDDEDEDEDEEEEE